MEKTRINVPGILAAKGSRKLGALTAYDAPTAALLDESGVDILLVGDSVEMVVYGARDTLSASLDRMIAHAHAVSSATKRALVVGDMPYLSYHTTPEAAVKNAGRFVVEGGCHAVKLEGGSRRIPMIRAILDAEIPVMGHLGLTPQSVNALGGFKVQGKSVTDADHILDEAVQLAEAGVFALVLECIPPDLAARITEAIAVPTIGIGAGPHCDGQILVTNDMLGLGMPGGHTPRFVRRYADLGALVRTAVGAYLDDVREGRFPGAAETFAPTAPAAPNPEETPVRLYGISGG